MRSQVGSTPMHSRQLFLNLKRESLGAEVDSRAHGSTPQVLSQPRVVATLLEEIGLVGEDFAALILRAVYGDTIARHYVNHGTERYVEFFGANAKKSALVDLEVAGRRRGLGSCGSRRPDGTGSRFVKAAHSVA